jgi:hypothetical protein
MVVNKSRVGSDGFRRNQRHFWETKIGIDLGEEIADQVCGLDCRIAAELDTLFDSIIE